MNQLENLSEEQLTKLIAAKKSEQSSGSPDYSQQYKRGISDSLRDIGYGLTKGAVGGLESMFISPIQKQFVEASGNKEPDINEVINKIKSPNPSPAGNFLQKAGEYAPLALGGLNALRGTEAIQGALRNIPSITRRGMEAPYARELRTVIEEGAGGLSHPAELTDQIIQFLQQHNVPMGTRLQRMLEGEHRGARQVRTTLGQLSRDRSLPGGAQIGAQNLHADLGNSILDELQRGGFHRTYEDARHADEHYRRSARLRELLTEGLRHVSGLSSLRAMLGIARRI